MIGNHLAINKILRILYCGLVGVLVVSFPIYAQQQKKTFRIGYLSSLSLGDEATAIDSFNRALRQSNGKNVVIEYRFANRNFRRLLELAAELVSLKVDLIVTTGSTPTRAVRAASSTIPIVLAQDSDPVGNGFVASLTRPGGNITGLSKLPPMLSRKQLGHLKELNPKLSRVAVLGNSINPGDGEAWKDTEAAARVANVQLKQINLLGSNDVDSVFEGVKFRADAILVLHSPLTFSRRTQIAELAAKKQMPAIYPATEFVEAGGLMGSGVDVNDLFRRAASYVDKILKGANPAHLPVGEPVKFNFVINLKTAKHLGLAIPQKMLLKADRLIS